MPQFKVVNRFRNVEFFFITKDGETRAMFEAFNPVREEDFDLRRGRTRITSPNEPYDLIAYEDIGDCRFWYSFAELNWPTNEDPLIPDENKTILIPSPDQILR